MTTTTARLDIRKLNTWLKANVPFTCKAVRHPHMEVVIGADAAHDLHAHANAIRAEFGGSILEVRAYGQKNYVSLIAR